MGGRRILLYVCALLTCAQGFVAPLGARGGAVHTKNSRAVAAAAAAAAAAETQVQEEQRVITIQPAALAHIATLRAGGAEPQLRVGVRAGGCMSYTMDFCKSEDITADDHVEYHDDGLRVVIDPKSMLFLFGLELGYSSEMIGGGFKFTNPNAEGSCGCGSSFSI